MWEKIQSIHCHPLSQTKKRAQCQEREQKQKQLIMKQLPSKIQLQHLLHLELSQK